MKIDIKKFKRLKRATPQKKTRMAPGTPQTPTKAALGERRESTASNISISSTLSSSKNAEDKENVFSQGKEEIITYALTRMKNAMNIKHKSLVYKGLIKPHFECCISVWGHKITKQLNQAHKKIIRTLNCKPRHTHAEPLMKKCDILH